MRTRRFPAMGGSSLEDLGSTSLPLKGVIFDLDDTLYYERDYELSGIRALCAWASDHLGYDYGTSVMALYGRYQQFGRVTPELFTSFVEELGKPAAHARTLAEVFRTHKPDIRPISGVVPMIEVMRFNYRIGVMAAGDADTALAKFKALDFMGRFDAVHPQTPYGAPWTRKSVLEWFQRSFDADADELAYVGAPCSKGFDAARALGWHTVLIRNLRKGGNVVSVPRSARHALVNILDIEPLLNNLGPSLAHKGDPTPREANGGGATRGRQWNGLVAALSPASVF